MAERPSSATPGAGEQPRLSVRLLGDGVIECGGIPVAELTSPRVLRFFARLATARGGRLERRRLAFDLWPESTEPQALTNLRKVLHDLRLTPGTGELLRVDHAAVSWSRAAADRVDVLQLRGAIDAGDGDGVADLYRGDLLPSCYDDWLLAERDRLREDAWTVIEAAARTSADPAARLTLAQALVSIDPLREEGYQLAMKAHATLGHRAEALRTYHRCVQVLENELDVQPDDVTLALYDEIRGGAAGATFGGSQRSGPVTATIVGRDDELTLVEGIWARTIAGASQVLLVTGEAGIGKTRLVAELARRVAAGGLPVATTRAYEAAGGLPWGPVTDWLRSDAVAVRVQRLDPPWRAELARLLPELGRDLHESDAPSRADPTRRRVLFDALVRVFAGIDEPLLLVLDDLQWCDDDTVEFLVYLVSRAPVASILIAATARPEELAGNERVQARLGAIAGDARLTEIELGRLDADSTARIAGEICARTVDAADGQRLFTETEGIPLFTVELARSGWAGQETATAMPPTMRSVIASRLAKLTASAREIAEVASGVGRAFTSEVVATAMGVEPDDLVDGLDELWRRQIIREHAHGYDFSHDKLREVIHVSIAPARGRRLHRQVAAALTKIHADDLAPVSRLIAAQLSGAGQPAEAIDAYRRAADYALGLFSVDEAIDCLQRALQCLTELPPGTERDRIELELRRALAGPLVWSSGFGSDQVINVHERVVGLLRRLAQPIDPAALRGLGAAHLTRCDFRRSLELAREILSAAGSDVVTLVEGNYLVGVSQFWRAELAESQRFLDAALALYSPEHSAEHIARFIQDPKAVCLVRLGQTRLWQGHPDEAQELLAQAIRHSEDLGHPGTLMYVHNFAQMTAIELGDLELAERCSTDLNDLVERFGGGSLWWFEALHGLLGACVRIARGEADAMGDLAETLERWHRTQSLHYSFGLLTLGRGHERFGDVEAGLTAVHEAMAWADTHDQRYLDAPLWLAEAELLERSGDATGARTARQQALAVARHQGAGWYEQQAIAALADATS